LDVPISRPTIKLLLAMVVNPFSVVVWDLPW